MERSEVSITHNRYRDLKPNDVDYRQFTGVSPQEVYFDMGKRHADELMAKYKSFENADLGIIADYGCGDGRVAIFMANKCKRIICLDISPCAFDAAKILLKSRGIKNTEFHQIDNYAGESNADFLYCLQVFQHNTYDEQIRIAAHVMSILKPGGVACLHFPKIEDKPTYKNHSTCMCFTKQQVEFFGKMFGSYEIEEVEFNPNWIDYYLWVTK